MKKIYVLCSLLFVVQWSQAQTINIPDANFKNYLLTALLLDTDDDYYNDSTIDINNDGEIQESEALLITSLTVNNKSISSLEGIQYFTNIEILNCSHNPITDLVLTQNVNLKLLICTNTDFSLVNVDLSQNTNLESISFRGNSALTSLDISQNVNLEYLEIVSCNISSLDVSQNVNLNYLDCSRNSFTSLDVSQNTNLERLICFSNDITSIDVSQNLALERLNLGYNLLTSIDVTQNINLKSLTIWNNPISNLDITQNVNLTSLDCREALLSSLDVTQNTMLQGLRCSSNSITELDLSQNPDLDALYCDENQLSTLDLSANPNIVWLDCSYNSLTNIDLGINPNLRNFDCSHNLLDNLNVATNIELHTLKCNHNTIEVLDLSQNPRLDNINCFNNQLTYLNVKNGIESSIYQFRFYNNPTLEFICVDEDELAAIAPSSSVPATAVVSTYCSFTPGGEYIVVEGTTRFDIDTNGCDVSDPVFPSMKYQIAENSTTETLIADISGNYQVYLSDDDANYTITPDLENPNYFTISPASITVDTSIASNPTIQDFCLTPNGIKNDLEVTIVPIQQARPGFDVDYQISYANKGNTTLSGNVQLMFNDDVMDLVAANPMNTSQGTNTLTWDFTNLQPFESRTINVTMNINSPTETPAVNGDDILSFEASLNTSETDETPEDNIMNLAQTVVNSFDPNDIRCLEGETVTTDYIDEYVHYLIRFENTGTAAAVNVIVTSEIDLAMFDISTLRPVSSSHQMETNIKGGNRVEFIFENINLPFDDATNDGYVVFKIKTQPALEEGDTFENIADIYFDFNLPITTNTSSTLISNPLSISEENLESDTIKIYPNPTRDKLFISATETIKSIEVRTLDGRLLKNKIITSNNNEYELDLADAATGVYLVSTVTNSRKTISKIVKE